MIRIYFSKCNQFCTFWEEGQRPFRVGFKWQDEVLLKDAGDKTTQSIPPDARWITVHPGGEDSTGVPVLIRENPDGSASVIAGAGGSLNHLNLSKLRSPQDWKDAAEDRRKQKAIAEKERRSKLSSDERKQEDDQKLTAKRQKLNDFHQNAIATLETLNQHGIDHGLSEEQIQSLRNPPEEGSSAEKIKEWKLHVREASNRARLIQQAYEYKLVTDQEARAAAFLSESENVVVQGRDHIAVEGDRELSRMIRLPSGDWLVRSSVPGSQDQVFGQWQEAAKAHVRSVSEQEQEQSQLPEFYDPARWIAEPKEEQLPEGFTFDPKIAAAIAQLSQDRKNITTGRNAEAAIARGNPNAPGYDAGVTGRVGLELQAKLEKDAKTLRDAIVNNSFLEVADSLGDLRQLRNHISFGGYAKLSEISSEVLKVSAVDVALVDAIGHNEAAKILAYQLQQNLSRSDYDALVRAQEAIHIRDSTAIAASVTEEVQPLLQELRGLHDEILKLAGESGEIPLDGEQQMLLESFSYQAESLNQVISKRVGEAAGGLQASAAMVLALKTNPKKLQFASEGKLADVPGQLWSREPSEDRSIFELYGLGEDDFELKPSPDGQSIVIKESGLKKLASAEFSTEDTAAYEEAQAIKRGDFDETDYLPPNFSYYESSTFTDVAKEKEQFNTGLEISPAMGDGDIEEQLKKYIGARVANGDDPLNVNQDIGSPELYAINGIDQDLAYRVQAIASNLIVKTAGTDQGSWSVKVPTAAIRQAFRDFGETEAKRQRESFKTTDLQALHSQQLDSETATEAAHRTLAAMPMARTAFKPLDQQTARERKWLRDYGISKMLGWELQEKPSHQTSTPQGEPEPEELQADLFGNFTSAAEVAQSQREPEISTTTLNQWQQFSKLVGGDRHAYAAVQDYLRGEFTNRFAKAYGAIAGTPAMIGSQQLSGIERVLIAKLPEDKRQEMLDYLKSRSQSDLASGRTRSGGKFAAELDDEWLQRYEEAKGDSSQLSLFTVASEKPGAKIDFDRTTLGDAAETQLAAVMHGIMGGYDQIYSPIGIIPNVSWGKGSGHEPKQRAAKFVERFQKVGVHFGAGSGKSATIIGTFDKLFSAGKIKKGIVAVPSAVLSQIVGECATFLKPGQYNYSANLGFSREQRIEALKNPDTHLHFTTRESLSNDLLYLVTKNTGISSDDFTRDPGKRAADGSSLPGYTEKQRNEIMQKALKAEGIDPAGLMLSIDESQDITTRVGNTASNRAIATTALSRHTPYYVELSGTPVKNDASEAWSFLNRMDPEKWNDRDKFLRQFGGESPAIKRALQRAIAPYSYTASTKPKDKTGRTLEMHEHFETVAASPFQASDRQRILEDYATISAFQKEVNEKLSAEMKSLGQSRPYSREDFAEAWERPEVKEAVARLAGSEYSSLSEEEKRNRIGGMIMGGSGLKSSAIWRLYHRTDYDNNPKMQKAVALAQGYLKEGQPGIVFTASAEAAKTLKDKLASEGIRVGVLDGSLSADQKSKIINQFSPANPNDAEFDVLIATDAAQTGVNATRGKFLIHLDVPQTDKAYKQRNARIHRLKQTHDTNVHTLLIDSPEDRIALARMQRKGDLAASYEEKTEHIDDSGLAAEINRQRAIAA